MAATTETNVRVYTPEQVVGIGDVFAALEAARDTILNRKLLEAVRIFFGFDLDGCLFRNERRTVVIFGWFIAWCVQQDINLPPTTLPETLEKAAWEVFRQKRVAYGPEENLRRFMAAAGIQNTDKLRGLEDLWVVFWRNHFFTNRALAEDEPAEEGVDFVTGVHDIGFFPAYLTGRHTYNPDSHAPEGMEAGTLHAFWKHRLPYGPLVMKGEYNATNDVAFKASEFAAQVALKRTHVMVGFVDNEPGCVAEHDRVMTEAGIPHVSVLVTGNYHKPVELGPNVLVLKSFGQ